MRALASRACSGFPPGSSSGRGGGSHDDDAGWLRNMSRLQKRISRTKEAAVAADRALASNWKRANFKMAYLGQSSSKGGAVMALEVRDGLVATATAVGEVCIQSLPAGSVIAQLSAPGDVSGDLTAMDFDGCHVIAGFASGEVAAWDIGPMIVGGLNTAMENESFVEGTVMPDETDGVEGANEFTHTEYDSNNKPVGDGADDQMNAMVARLGRPVFVGVHSDNGIPVTGVTLCDRPPHASGAVCPLPDFSGQSIFPKFITSSADGMVRCWGGQEAKGWTSLQSRMGPVCCVSTFGSQYVIAGTMTGHVQIWPQYKQYSNEDPIITFRAHESQVTALQHFCAGTSDEKLITGGADGLVRVWDMTRGGKPIHEFKGHDDGITSVQSDSSKVVTAGLDNTVRVWDASNGKQLYRLNGEATDAISARFEGPWLVWNGISRSVLLMDYS